MILMKFLHFDLSLKWDLEFLDYLYLYTLCSNAMPSVILRFCSFKVKNIWTKWRNERLFEWSIGISSVTLNYFWYSWHVFVAVAIGTGQQFLLTNRPLEYTHINCGCVFLCHKSTNVTNDNYNEFRLHIL